MIKLRSISIFHYKLIYVCFLLVMKTLYLSLLLCMYFNRCLALHLFILDRGDGTCMEFHRVFYALRPR